MTNLKKTLAGAALSLCATVALVAAGAPAANATYLNTCAGNDIPAEVCINNLQWVEDLVAIPGGATTAVHVADAVAFIDTYNVPNSSVSVLCVVFAVNATTTNPCASIGLVRDPLGLHIPLYAGPVDGATPTVSGTLAKVMLCTGTLNANYERVGINDQAIFTPCVDSNLF
jgi:hypothetical protein